MSRFWKDGMLGFAIMALISCIGSSASANPNSLRHVLCASPVGSSSYLPSNLVSAEQAGPVEDAFSGVLRLSFSMANPVTLIEAAWIRQEGVVSTSEPLEGGRIIAGYQSADIRRFDVFWQRGSSVTLLIKQLESENPWVAYADIKAGFGLDKVGSYVASCEAATSANDVIKRTDELMRSVAEFERSKLEAATAAGNAVDEMIRRESSPSPQNGSKPIPKP